MEEEYEKFEAFWGIAKEKAIADGIQAGWSIWKVDPSSNDDNPWADYIIVNIYQSKEQIEPRQIKLRQIESRQALH